MATACAMRIVKTRSVEGAVMKRSCSASGGSNASLSLPVAENASLEAS